MSKLSKLLLAKDVDMYARFQVRNFEGYEFDKNYLIIEDTYQGFTILDKNLKQVNTGNYFSDFAEVWEYLKNLRESKDLNESKKYTKKGNLLKLKEPLMLNKDIDIIGLSRDRNGNPLLRVEIYPRQISIQYKAISGMSRIDIDELVDGSFLNRSRDINNLIKFIERNHMKKNSLRESKEYEDALYREALRESKELNESVATRWYK